MHRAASRRFYIDEVYLFVTRKFIYNCISHPIAWFDRHVIDATMDGFASVTQWTSLRIRKMQSGDVQDYAFMILLGSLVIAGLIIFI